MRSVNFGVCFGPCFSLCKTCFRTFERLKKTRLLGVIIIRISFSDILTYLGVISIKKFDVAWSMLASSPRRKRCKCFLSERWRCTCKQRVCLLAAFGIFIIFVYARAYDVKRDAFPQSDASHKRNIDSELLVQPKFLTEIKKNKTSTTTTHSPTTQSYDPYSYITIDSVVWDFGACGCTGVVFMFCVFCFLFFVFF